MKIEKFALRFAFLLSPVLILRFKGITMSDYLFLLTFILALIKRDVKHPQNRILRKFQLPILLIFLPAAVSTVVNPNQLNSFTTLVKFVVLLICIPWTINKITNSQDDWEELIKFYSFGLFIFCFAVVYIRITNFGLNNSINSARESGLAQHITDAGGICTISVIAGFTLLQKKTKIMRYTFTTFSILALIFTGSISGYISTLVGLLLIYFRHSKKRIVIKDFLKLPILAGFTFAANNLFQISERYRHATSGRYDTAGSRIENWKSTLEMALKDLKSLMIGNGLHPADNIIASSNGEKLTPHNIFLESLSAAGIFFAIGILVYLCQVLIIVVKKNEYFDFFPLLVASLIFAMTSPLMYSRYIWLPFLIALTFSTRKDESYTK